jgi:hypothetical protein
MKTRRGPFHPLHIDATPCGDAVVRDHLAEFVRRFVRADRRDRAEHVVFRLAPKDADELKALQHMLDERYTTPPSEIILPTDLPELGVYYAGGNEGWIVRRDDVEAASSYLGRDAVWSAIAGVYAMFLQHHGMRWVCYRKPDRA